MQVLIVKKYDNVTIDSAKATEAVYAPQAEHIAFVVTASSASSPVGTTIQIMGSIDGTNFAALNGTVNITGNGVFTINVSAANASYLYYKLAYARSSGSYVASTSILVKGVEL